MLTEERISEIYERAMKDEMIFENLLNDPQSLQTVLKLTDTEIDDIVSMLNVTYSLKTILGNFNNLVKDKGFVIGPLPGPWQLFLKDKLKNY